MKRWEYKFISVYEEAETEIVEQGTLRQVTELQELLKKVNDAAKDGWRLISINLPIDGADIVMEREVPESDATSSNMSIEDAANDPRR